jgi:NADH:ubiquinone oxidoreductase subunit K
MAPVFTAVTGKVDSFGQNEFELLSEAVRQEVVKGQLFEDYLNAVSEEPAEGGLDMILIQVVAAIVGLGIPLCFYRRNGVINKAKAD